MDILIVVAVAASVGAIVWLITYNVLKSKISAAQSELLAERRICAEKDKLAAERQQAYENTLKDMRETHERTLKQQMETVKATMTAESEKILKAREEELGKRAEKTFSDITENLGKDLKDMKEAFEQNKKTQTESSAAMKTHLEVAVKNLEQQTRDIGSKADHLASAMRGQTKFQGCWGETILNNIFIEEGLVEGRDYDQEQTLRDEMGIVIKSEEEHRMRPDFVLHYPDDTDIIVDSKVSLNALSDYFEAESDEARAEAAKRNLDAVKMQVQRLSKKDYSSYLKQGRKTLDYVVMFIPNYAALQLAKSLDPNIWRDSFKQNVLITTEETIMPFLRMIRSAWINVEQARNQQQIILSAQRMVDRVYDFAKAHAEMGQKLDDARKCFEKCDGKLRDSGQSIIVAAKQVQKLGVPANPAKPLPETL